MFCSELNVHTCLSSLYEVFLISWFLSWDNSEQVSKAE